MKTDPNAAAESPSKKGRDETVGYGAAPQTAARFPLAMPPTKPTSTRPKAPSVPPAEPTRAPDARRVAATLDLSDRRNETPATHPTVGYGEAVVPPSTTTGLDATLAQPSSSEITVRSNDGDLGATLAQSASTAPIARTPTAVIAPAGVRTTVLPRVDWSGDQPALSVSPRKRFERVRALGEGGVGEVSLVHDYDIDRDVAVKRLHPQFNDAVSLMRFAEEVRAVGNLEHPNIAPVHDVGIDEDGQHFLLMKYVQGETLEHVIERLAAKDPAYEARFSYDARAEIFRGILRAVQFAHARGIIHRDIKPANVMIGPFGEVVVMDWGLAKQVRGMASGADVDRLDAASAAPADDDATERVRMFRTRRGAILGTPAYMAPEQARGDIAHIDERSDIYSLCVLFHELLTLEHYLADKQTVVAVLAAVAEHNHTSKHTTIESIRSHAPIEYLHLVRHGLQHDPAQRFQTVGEILDRLQADRDGLPPIECPVSLVKRVGGESMRFVDRHPLIAVGGVFAGAAATLAGVVMTIVHVL